MTGANGPRANRHRAGRRRANGRRAGRRSAVLLAVAALAVGACSSDDPTLGGASSATSVAGGSAATSIPSTTAVAIAGLEQFSITATAHVTGPVTYAQTPPVGGEHAAIWQNCGFYSTPVSTEAAVHSLEHGAVWVTHRPDLPAAQVATLRALAAQTFVLVSPWAGDLPAPVVASAWNRQLKLPSADDPRLAQFVSAFRMGRQSPEPGARCTEGVGQPE